MVVPKTKTARELYYIAPVENLESILENGVLSHNKIKGKDITKIYEQGIVDRRKNRKTSDGKSLWDYANLYFNPRNAMLYKIKCNESLKNIVILGISTEVFNLPHVFITNGNAAADETKLFPYSQSSITNIIRETSKEWWYDEDGSKRKVMAETLVPDLIPPKYIISIYVSNPNLQKKIEENMENGKDRIPPIILQPYLFFEDAWTRKIPPNITLSVGDMFFSEAQTLTISVNTKGVMGKGVASRAKNQFPDVYVRYEKVCRNGSLKLGKPYLYKRETSSAEKLAYEPNTLTKCPSPTWFLLFATKNHWREDSDINAIEEGLQWLVKKHKNLGIESLALPALGCGLGNLQWKDVGPLLCRYLGKMDISVSIYLPLEKSIPDKFLTKEFLLPEEQTKLC
jgi:O-acetyl-ADP-ribose deacetylase (regulator of RNase III)